MSKHIIEIDDESNHDIDVLGCGVIYIDKERVFGSKPYGLFSTINWKATDEDLKRIADRCLEVISNRKTENGSENPNNCKYLINPSGDVWECGCCFEIYCEHQIYDRNLDGTLNIVKCGFKPKTPRVRERKDNE